MNHYLESVKEFHESFNHPVNHEIQTDNFELRKLRLSLIFEEMVELAHAMGCTEHLEKLCEKHKHGTHSWLFNGQEPGNLDMMYNQKESLDALCDIQYVVSGAVLALGFTDVFDEAFDEVQRSNMSKSCKNLDEAEETMEYHRNKGEKQLMSPVSKDDKFIVVREDGKILKNKYYSPAKLEAYIK